MSRLSKRKLRSLIKGLLLVYFGRAKADSSLPAYFVQNVRHEQWSIPQTDNEGSMFIQARAHFLTSFFSSAITVFKTFLWDMDIFPYITVLFLKPLHSARDRNPYSSASVAIARRLLVTVFAPLRSIDRKTLDAPYTPYLSPEVTVNLTRGGDGIFCDPYWPCTSSLCALLGLHFAEVIIIIFLFNCFGYMAFKSTVVKGKTRWNFRPQIPCASCKEKKGILQQTRPALQAITHRDFGSTQKLQQSLERSQSRSLYINTPVWELDGLQCVV